MKLRPIALAAATTVFVACNLQDKSDTFQISPNSDDASKIAYMLGVQIGRQTYDIAQNALEFTLDNQEFHEAIGDGAKLVTDSGFQIKYPDSAMMQIAMMMNSRAGAIQAAKAPLPVKKDSTDSAAAPKQPEKPSPMTAEQANKASYLLGVQFGQQFASISKQAEMDLNIDAFRQSIRDARAKAADTAKTLQLPEDTLKAVGQRFQSIMLEKRKAAIEKAKKEEQIVKEKVAGLRGETLSDGTQAKLNYKVGVTGVNVSAKDFEAYAGKNLFVFYFSTTCGHCRKATPDVKALAEQFKDKDIKTVAVASGGNNKRDIRSFIEEHKLDEAAIDVFFDEGREFGELYSDGYVPKVYIVKADGSLSTFKNFEAQKDSITAELSKLAK